MSSEQDLLYPAFQKFYSALSSLERFHKEKSFFENISSLDTFFSEFRNVTFVLQKSLAHTDYMRLYEDLREKYFSELKWFVETRNETTKQHPFELIKKIKITVLLHFVQKREENSRTPCAVKSQSGIIGRVAPFYSV